MAAWSGLFDGFYATPYARLSDTVQIGNVRTNIARQLRSRTYDRGKIAGLLLALSGAVAGGAALVQHKRVQSVADRTGNAQGGARTIETVDDVNRVTAAADETFLELMYNLPSAPSSYPVDLSGNGGGGKLPR